MVGKNFSLYISGEDMELLQRILSDRGEDASEQACIDLARMAAKSGIYQLVIAKKSEQNSTLKTEMQRVVDQLFAMVRYPLQVEAHDEGEDL